MKAQPRRTLPLWVNAASLKGLLYPAQLLPWLSTPNPTDGGVNRNLVRFGSMGWRFNLMDFPLFMEWYRKEKISLVWNGKATSTDETCFRVWFGVKSPLFPS